MLPTCKVFFSSNFVSVMRTSFADCLFLRAGYDSMGDLRGDMLRGVLRGVSYSLEESKRREGLAVRSLDLDNLPWGTEFLDYELREGKYSHLPADLWAQVYKMNLAAMEERESRPSGRRRRGGTTPRKGRSRKK